MKNQIKFLALVTLFFSFFGCPKNEAKVIVVGKLNASIDSNCTTTVQNFIGDDVYDFKKTDDSEIGKTYWQFGAHPSGAINEEPDLGVNIVVSTLATGTYPIADTHGDGTVFIYYTDENGNHYVSSFVSGSITVTTTEDPLGTLVEITFDGVQLYCAEIDDTICIGNFEFEKITTE